MKFALDPWILLGFLGQFVFSLRFIIQWICSEKKGESYIPVAFWFCGLAGGVILLIYAIHRKDPVFIVGQVTGVTIYLRNLQLIFRKKNALGMDRAKTD